jgi:DNA-binding NarL/FixJ family response regulator
MACGGVSSITCERTLQSALKVRFVSLSVETFKGSVYPSKPLWKRMFAHHSQAQSQNGNMDAMGIGKFQPREFGEAMQAMRGSRMKEQTHRLGPREQQIVELLLQGCDNAEIASRTEHGAAHRESSFQSVISPIWHQRRYQASETRDPVIPEASMSASWALWVRVPSEREQRVIQLVAEGMKNKEVAEVIGTTEHVMKNYLRVIYDKLGLWNRVELALWYESRRTPSALVTQ